MLRLKSIAFFLILQFYIDVIDCKGLYSGVPCHRPYFCILGDQHDHHEESQLLDEVEDIQDEKSCQELCATLEGCISYTWWNEKALNHPHGKPFLCQFFAVCDRWYFNPNLTPVYSGASQCKNPIIIFGGDGADKIDPKSVETLWPGVDDKYDSLGHISINDFDPIPEWPEYTFAMNWHSSAIQIGNLILSCGGGLPPTNRCFGLDLVTGSWKPMAPMKTPRTGGFSIINVGQHILVIGGLDDVYGDSKPLIEMYNKDLDSWTSMPQWNGPYYRLKGHCALPISDHQVLVIGGLSSYSFNNSKILDINTGEWTNTAPFPNPRTGHACVLTTINKIRGVLVTGGTDNQIDPDDICPGCPETSTNFYNIEADSWTTLANASYPVQYHQMVLYEDRPTIIGGEYELFALYDIEPEVTHHRAEIQSYYESGDYWVSGLGLSMNHKRSKFVAVSVEMQEP